MMTTAANKKINARAGLIVLIFVAFIALGMPDGLIGVAWPTIRSGFKLPVDAMGSWLFASMIGYMVASFFNGKVISRIGVGGTLAASCALTGAALIGYTLVPAWWMLVGTGVFAGLGAGAIDAGLNTYVASNFKENIMQWLHAFYGVGVTLGPIIMTNALNLFDNWRLGYQLVGAVQLALGLAFLFSLKKWQNHSSEDKDAPKILTEYKTPMRETLKRPITYVSVLLFFVYVGAEMSLGTWVYTLLTEGRHISVAIAGYLAGSYYITFTIGRMTAGLLASKFKLKTLLSACMIAAFTGAVMLMVNISNTVSIIGVAIIGFAIAPIFPGLQSDTSDRVSAEHGANTIGIQMSLGAGLGGSVISALVGVFAAMNRENIAIIMVILYALLFGLYWLSLWMRKSAEKPEAETEPETAA
jgi:fucose permease